MSHWLSLDDMGLSTPKFANMSLWKSFLFLTPLTACVSGITPKYVPCITASELTLGVDILHSPRHGHKRIQHAYLAIVTHYGIGKWQFGSSWLSTFKVLPKVISSNLSTLGFNSFRVLFLIFFHSYFVFLLFFFWPFKLKAFFVFFLFKIHFLLTFSNYFRHVSSTCSLIMPTLNSSLSSSAISPSSLSPSLHHPPLLVYFWYPNIQPLFFCGLISFEVTNSWSRYPLVQRWVFHALGSLLTMVYYWQFANRRAILLTLWLNYLLGHSWTN